MVAARTYWTTMWWLLALGFGLLLLAAVTSIVAVAVCGGLLVMGGLLALRLWMWQKAYEGAQAPSS